ARPLFVPPDEKARRKPRRAAAPPARLGRGPAHVKGDRSVEVERLTERHSPNHPASRPRFQHLDTLPTRRRDVGEPTVRLHDHELTAEARPLEALLQVTEVAAHDWTDIGVRDHG